ncbi:MAG: pyrroline-5-carboxylate reductase [Candidatus Nanopelagicaceae bacterium]|nr:pyrroline-5-carboxylate reductase [Candidatus Nanopelagicaceae bacterium]
MTSIENPGHIGVIGAGIMGEALVSAMISAGVKPEAITISEKREERATELTHTYGVQIADLESNVAKSDVLLLVVKPQDMAALLLDMKDLIRPTTLLISFAAGKRIEFISNHLDSPNPVIRVMPNTPTLVGEGMAAISVGPHVTPEQSAFVRDFLAATGRVVEVDESLQDAVTAVSGSGPAYFFYFVESMIKAGVDLGLPEVIATELTIQTIVGSAKLLATSEKSPATLRENVTSPNGTTAAAISSFSQSDLPEIVKKAMTAARDRSQELA